MPSYRIPSDDRVRASLVRVFSTRQIVDSQRRLKALVEKDMKGDERYRVGEPIDRIPSDDRVRASLVRVFSTRQIVDSQRRLKALVEKDMKGDERYRVGEP